MPQRQLEVLEGPTHDGAEEAADAKLRQPHEVLDGPLQAELGGPRQDVSDGAGPAVDVDAVAAASRSAP